MRLVLTVFFVILAGAVGWYLGWRYGQPLKNSNSKEQPTQSSERVPEVVFGQGKLQPQSGLIKIVGPPGERVESLFDAKVGDEVVEDQELVLLQSHRMRQIELDLAIARKNDALVKAQYEKQLAEFKKRAATLAVEETRSADEMIASKSTSIELLKRQRETAENLLEKLRRLRNDDSTRNIVNESEIEKQDLLVDQLALQIEHAELELDQSKERAIRAKQAAEIDLQTVDFALANDDAAIPLKSLDKSIAAAESALALTTIKSPIDGRILDIIVRPGDAIANQSIMLIGDTSQMMCVAEINDSQIRHVHVGARAKISSSALPNSIYGTVQSKGVMVGPPSMKDPNPFGSVDRSTSQVLIRLDDSEFTWQVVNTQVDVEIEITQGALAASEQTTAAATILTK
jgi:HlyD family secretion protein